MNFLLGMLTGILLIILITVLLPTDDTDKSIWRRSGARLITDHRTGLQYLEGARGGIIPRLDSEGNHMRIYK